MSIIINGIRGWFFPPAVVEEANRRGELLTLDTEWGDICPLRCDYCFRSGDSRDQIPLPQLLDFEQWKRMIDQAVALGIKSVKMIGGGEMTEEKGFIEAMEYIASKGIIIVFFTSGTTLGDETRCRKFRGMSCKELAQWMYDLGMSVFIKMDALDGQLQDNIVGLPGYAAIRDRGYKLLKETGFNIGQPTRLGLEVNVGAKNLHEIMKIYELRIKDNVYEDVVISMPCGRYFRNPGYDITLDQKRELYRDIYRFNIEHDIPFQGISPFMGGLICNQLGNGLYITNRGDVYHCPGTFELLGNVKDEPLGEIWGRVGQELASKYRRHYSCPPREGENEGKAEIIPICLFKEIAEEFPPTTL